MKKKILLFVATILLCIASIFAQGGSYLITVSANPPEGGTVIGGGMYKYLETVTVKAFPSPGYTFEYWNIGGVMIFTGPVHTFHATYSYNVVAHFKKTIDIKENIPNSEINIFPNPTTGELRITNYGLRITDVEVFDIYGRKQKAESRKQDEIDISGLSAGIYFIKITTEQGVVVKKVVKQ